MEGVKEMRRTVCVTGAGGYIASWLVKFLLERGYRVHGTVRDPTDERNAHLMNLGGAADNLQLFKADLLDSNALRAAIEGCEGVFHVASPLPPSKVPNPEVEVIEPAVSGTLNVLKECSRAKIKRVIVVSSGAAVVMSPHSPEDKVKDETCWSDKEYCRRTENWYFLSKTLAEEAAFNYAKQHQLDVVTVLPAISLGPLLQSTINASSLYLINFLKGKVQTIENTVHPFVDVRDVAEALILVYEKPEASGRYICAPHHMEVKDLLELLKSMYPDYDYPKNFTDGDSYILSSDKLKALGWKYRKLEETLVDSVEYYKKAGLLNKD